MQRRPSKWPLKIIPPTSRYPISSFCGRISRISRRTRERRICCSRWSSDRNAEAPIEVAPEDNPTNEPVPDLIVLRQDQSHFTSNPRAQDLLLAVEIADTSLNFDLTVKAALYARAGVSEYW